MEVYAAVRHFVLGEGMFCFSPPPGDMRTMPATKPKLAALQPVIDVILAGDRTGPVRQRHSAKRILERLRDEHVFGGGCPS